MGRKKIAERNGFSAAGVIFSLFAAALVLAPLPLGAARPWSGMLLLTLLAICTLGWGAVVLYAPQTPGVPVRRLAFPMVFFTLALAWATVQTLPVVPATWAHPIWREAENVLSPMPRLISLSPAAGQEEAMYFLGYGLVFLLAVQMGRLPQRAESLIQWLGLGGGMLAAYGLVAYLSGAEKILWLDKWAYTGDLTATLVNRNHYATLAGLGLLCAVVAVLKLYRRHGSRECLRRLLKGQDWRLAGLLMASPILATALICTHSRAGLAVTVLGGAVLALLVQRWRWRWAAVLVIAMAVAVVMGLGELNQRMQDLPTDAEQRLRVYSLSWVLLQDRPWQGYGLGAFVDAFQAIRPPQITQYWPQAHNSWLETMIELGVPAALCLFMAMFWAFGRCVIGALRRRRDGEFCALAVAAAVLAGTHALVDFSLHIPAVSVVFAAILGVGVAQSWSSRLAFNVR